MIVLAHAQSHAGNSGIEAVSRQLGNDLFVTGSEIRLAGEINGDAIAAGGSVTLDAPVRGDAMIAGGELTLRGATDEDLYAAGGCRSVDTQAKTGGAECMCASRGVVDLIPRQHAA
ncbi:MAG: hypothetical protein ACREUF_06415 [Solimonas sp.]